MKHKYVAGTMMAALMVLSVVFLPGAMATGNGAPSGAHYNLNLIGKDKEDILPNDNQGGNRIFVNLYTDGIEKRNKIYLIEGDDFSVIDPDATDGRAEFQLPAPYDVEGNQVYEVYIRPVGKPGGSGEITTCTETVETVDGVEVITEICSLNSIELDRDKGPSKFELTKELTQVTYYDADGNEVTVNIFDDAFEDYFWDYDNNGMKIVQLRFYPIS